MNIKKLTQVLCSSLTLLYVAFGEPGQAEELTFDHIFDEDLIAPDKVSLRVWGKEGRLYERRDEGSDFVLWRRDASSNTLTKLVSGEELAAAFRRLPGFAQVTGHELKSFEVSPTEQQLLFYIARDYFIYDLSSHTVERLTFTPHAKVGEAFSPNGESLAYIEQYNIWLVDLKSKQSRQLTFDGSARLLYGRLDWVYQEEVFGRGDYRGYWWSPDSQHIAFLRIDESPVGEFPLVDHMETYGNLELMSYPKAGTPNPQVTVGVVAARGGNTAWLDLSPYELTPYLVVGVGFTPDSQHVNVQIQDRIQSSLDLMLYPIEGGEGQLLLREKSDDWVNRLQEAPVWDGGQGFYWRSERSGYAHLYYYATDANYQVTATKALTSGDWDVLALLSAQGDDLYFTANKASLLEDHLYHLSRKSLVVSQLTPDGFHHRASLSPEATYLVLAAETLTQPAERRLMRMQGGGLSEIAPLFIPDLTKLQALALPAAEFLKVPARNGFFMNALLIKPSNFNEDAKYPVLTYVYAGPRTPVVRNEFRKRNFLWHHYLAQQGYVIWMCDNRSASRSGHVSEAGVYKRLGVQELDDIEEGIAYLKRNPWIDGERLGIWGWSFGGFQTSYALTHSETFKTGIAVAPVTDWRLYDSIYTERYMSTPQANPEGYRCSSVLGCARRVKDKNLLLVHGTLDDNVHFQHSVQFIYELEKARVDFDMMIYPRSDHGIQSELHPHLFDKMTKFVREHL